MPRFNKTPELAMVPGGTGSIGSEVVEMLLDKGTTVVVPTRSGQHDLPQSSNLSILDCDYCRDEEVEALVGEYPTVDTLVHCAGYFAGHLKASDYTDDDVVKKFQAGIRSFWHFLRHALPQMRESNYGNIIGISSLAAEERKPYLGLSNWAKTGLEAIIQTVSNEESINGVRANALLPSIVDTPKERGIFSNADFKYFLPTSDIAGLVEFLSYDERGRYINGATIPCYVPNPRIMEMREEDLRERGVEL